MSETELQIAFCLPKLTGGADLLQQMRIATGLQARGHTLTFIAPRDLSETICTRDIQSATIAPRTWSNRAWFNLASRVTWRLQQLVGVPYLNVFSNYCLYDACLQCLPGHDVVHERNGLYKMGVAMACKKLGLPYLLFFDADDLFELDFLGTPITGILRWRAKQIIRYTLSVADGIICVSQATRLRLINVWHVPSEKIAVFPNGVDVDLYKPYPDKRRDIRASLGLSDQPVVIYVGSFYRWHDVATLLDAFVQVLPIFPNAILLLIGDGENRLAMEKYAHELGIEHAVKFTGRLAHSEIPYLINAADIAVSPYPKMEEAWWGSSMKLFEYLASGSSIIASNIGEQVSEVIQDGVNGLLVEPGDAAALASALMKLIINPGLRSRLGQRAREDAVMKYSWDQYLTRLESVYEEIIREKNKYKAI
jgi:glycosyltransferase involved in cell wall biosynthesis